MQGHPDVPDRHRRAADVGSGTPAQREQEVDDAHDNRQRACGGSNQANDVKVLADLLHNAIFCQSGSAYHITASAIMP